MVYHSVTGNTEKIARAIHEEIQSECQTELLQVKNVNIDRLDVYDLIIVGAPCHDSDLSVPTKHLLEALPVAPEFKLAGFFTHSTHALDGSESAKELFEKWAGACPLTFERIAQEKGIDFLGYFNCEGAPSPDIEVFIKQTIITDDDEWNALIPELRKRPNEMDVERAKTFASALISKLGK